VSRDALVDAYHLDIDSLMTKWSAHVVGQYQLDLLVHRGPGTWYLVML
jgi:hypothetical protein